jgi:hypothetical protein
MRDLQEVGMRLTQWTHALCDPLLRPTDQRSQAL